MHTTSEQTVRDIVRANPASARVFEALGIDYCCGGSHSISAACACANVPLETVKQLLAECGQPITEKVWDNAPLGEITQHIIERHHGFVRRESPRIQELLNKIETKHGPKHGELSELKTLFATLTRELAEHMLKEERVLFPYIQALSAGAGSSACFGSVESSIAVMIADHENAGAILSKMRALSYGYKPPEAACPTFHETYRSLEEFERDLHWHVHLENNILFPRAIAAERDLWNTLPSAN
jgi:regulator of cell morphogenesis and NO signaling